MPIFGSSRIGQRRIEAAGGGGITADTPITGSTSRQIREQILRLQRQRTTAGAPTPGGGFTGDTASFLESLFTSRPKFVQQQQDLLNQLGPSSRQAILNASPELAAASQHITSTFQDPFGGAQSTFQDAIRTAQAARGFGGGGTGVAGEEARFLTNYAQQRRDALLPQAQSFGTNLLNISGLGGPPDISLGALGSLGLGYRRLLEEIEAGNRQAQYAERLFNLSGGGGGGFFGSVDNTPGGGTGFFGAENTPYLPNEDFYARQRRVTQKSFNPFSGQRIQVSVPS
ncbi:MAG: hypothetical protein L0214_15485 [candidate division NC10 bacterium]|nr:hypothetical protein [candidate division NC10 bacterium]